jgi:hypothetical protein
MAAGPAYAILTTSTQYYEEKSVSKNRSVGPSTHGRDWGKRCCRNHGTAARRRRGVYARSRSRCGPIRAKVRFVGVALRDNNAQLGAARFGWSWWVCTMLSKRPIPFRRAWVNTIQSGKLYDRGPTGQPGVHVRRCSNNLSRRGPLHVPSGTYRALPVLPLPLLKRGCVARQRPVDTGIDRSKMDRTERNQSHRRNTQGTTSWQHLAFFLAGRGL